MSAAHAYAMALSLKADNSDTHLQIGHLHRVSGDTQKAVQSYKSALKLNPENWDAAKELRALGVADQELASIIEGEKKDGRNIGLSPVDRSRAARFSPSAREYSQPAPERENRSTLEPADRRPTVADMFSPPKQVFPQVGKHTTISTIPQQRKLVAQKGGPPTRRRKWGRSLAAVIIVLSLVSGGTLMSMGSPIEIAQDAYRRAVAEMQRRTARENTATEAAARKAAEEKALAEAERKAAEQNLAAAASARRHEEEARQAAEEKAEAEAARKTTEAKARAAARGDSAHLKAEEAARKPAEVKPKSEAGVRQQAEKAEAELNLSEQDRKKVQVSLTALGYQIPTGTGYFGSITRTMITAWQKKQGLPETGFLDESQLVALHEQATLAKRADQAKPATREQAERAESGLNLSEQDRKRVQVALNSLGHEIPTATGYFGPRTRAMITVWQKTQGLPETGYLTEIQLPTLLQQAAPALAIYDQAQRKPKEDRAK